MPSPVGIIIGSDKLGRPQWKIGNRIGLGACASVHLLQPVSPSSTTSTQDWVVKVAPRPTKTTRKGTSPEERNYNLISSEALVYQTQFAEYHGIILPKLPQKNLEPPITGELDFHQYFTMERMEAGLWNTVPLLLKGAKGNIVDIGPIAQQLITIVQLMHLRNHVIVDVKPENFMLAAHSHHSAQYHQKGKMKPHLMTLVDPTTVAEEIATKLRLLDLGLAAMFRLNGGHRDNEGISNVIGTPLYVSRNVHKLQTPSRRDDMEALGYVIAEMIIRLVAAANETSQHYEATEMPSYLPWSLERSDEAISKRKDREVEDAQSSFYQRMGSNDLVKSVLKEFFDRTKALKYKQEPDYDAFRDLLSSLVVTLDSVVAKKNKNPTKQPRTVTDPFTRVVSKLAAKRTTTEATATCGPLRSTRTSKRAGYAMEEEELPKKQTKVISLLDDSDGDDDVFEDTQMSVDSDDDDDTVFHDTSQQGPEEMDWEPSTKENVASKPKMRHGLKLDITDGPHAGDSFDFVKGEHGTVIIGTNPKSSSKDGSPSEHLWSLPLDTTMGTSHVKLELKANKQSSSMKITDLKSGVNTMVDKTTMRAGSNVQCFIGSHIRIGASVFAIKTLSPLENGFAASNVDKAAANKTKTPLASTSTNKKKSGVHNAISKMSSHLSSRGATVASTVKPPNVILQVTSGLHEGESFSLSESRTHIFHFGSATVTAKTGESVVLKDSGIEKRHATVKLIVGKVVKVSIKSLVEDGSSINAKQLPKGKEQIAFLNDKIGFGDKTEIVIKSG